MDKPIDVQELRDAVAMDCQIVGGAERTVTRPAPIDDAGPDAVTFYSKGVEGAAARIGASDAGVVLCTPEAATTIEVSDSRTLLLVSNPRLAFIRVMNRFFAPPRPVGIHPTAVIHPEAKLGKDVYIGPFTYVGKAEIGDYTVVEGHGHIGDKVRIGGRCWLQPHCVLGCSSFALERNADGQLEGFPQLGGVALGDDVQLGRGATVDRATFGCTEIASGCRIDGGAVIAHNCRIERCAAIGWRAVLLGAVHVGERAWVSPGACIREGVEVGLRATVGMGAVVTKDVPSGATVYGVPAREALAR